MGGTHMGRVQRHVRRGRADASGESLQRSPPATTAALSRDTRAIFVIARPTQDAAKRHLLGVWSGCLQRKGRVCLFVRGLCDVQASCERV